MIDDFDGPQFCEDYGYCICGNDCFEPEGRVLSARAPMAEGIAAILTEHFIDITETSPDNMGRCICGGWVDSTMSISWDEHQAEVLAAAGYGKLEEAWDEGYKFGVEDERTSEANIGIAGDLCNQTPCQCKVQPARVNPHRRPE